MAKRLHETVDTIEQSSILGDTPVLTMQQRHQAEQQKKAAEKAAKKKLAAQMRAEAKSRAAVSSDGKTMTIIIVVMVAILIAAIVLMITGQGGSGMQPKENMTYFLDNTLLAEMGDDGVQGAITEAYYTKNGGMRLNMNFSNADDISRHPTRIYVKLMNAKDEVIAEAAVTDVRDDLYMVAGGRTTYEMFIPAKYVKIADDPLSEISFEITVDSEEYNSKN